MIISSRWTAAALALSLLAFCAVCLANPVKRIEEEELKLLEKYEKILAEERDDDGAEVDEREPTSEHLVSERDLLDLLESFDKLNHELEANSPNSNDVDKTLAQVASLVAASDQKQARAAETLMLLGQIHGKPKSETHMCSAFSETVLRLNAYLAGALARSSRLATVVRQVSEEHARECQGVYAIKYHEQLALLDEHDRAQLFGVLSDELVANFMAYNPSSFVDLMHGYQPQETGISSSWKPQLAARIFVALKRKTMGDLELEFIVKGAAGKMGVDERKFEAAYKQLLKRPCGSFVASLEKDVFGPATFDFGVSNAALLKGSLSSEEIAFAFGFFRFKVCEMLLDDKKDAFAQDVKSAVNH